MKTMPKTCSRCSITPVTVSALQVELQWSCCKFLWSVRRKALWKMKNAKCCFGSDVVVRSIRNVVTWLLDTCRWWWRVTSWVRHEALLQVTMHRGIDGMLIFSSGLCSWINKDSRTCSRRQLSLPMTLGLWKSTRWSGLACKCLQTDELSDVRCSSMIY